MYAHAQVNTNGIVSTTAGMSGSGYNSDGVAVTSTRLWYPYGISLDAAGNVYIADAYNHKVRKVSVCICNVRIYTCMYA